jgi:hypothetical protein
MHQDPQKNRITGFPRRSLRETVFPAKLFREKAGASFFSGNRVMPKDSIAGESDRAGGTKKTFWKKAARAKKVHKRIGKIANLPFISPSRPNSNKN